MSYMALYRKWRPDSFEEVKGQEHIVTTLKNQVMHQRVGHAYLFCGTRGTGKTTIAKLMAKTINCEHPVDGSPCNECESCKAIARGSAMNVIEIDAASNNGVDNIRQINSAVQYSPSTGKYLVYIIDEVHMLSMGAFNALLKTLEEPPEYVVFILATTEAHKVPVTIMSRCQRYDFRRISIETITDRLAELLSREGIPATREALTYVARAADGSMRDALSILDECVAFHLGEEVTYEMVLDTIGAVDTDIYISLFSAILARDVGKAIGIVDDCIWQGKDLTQMMTEMIGFLRNVLMLKLTPDFALEMSKEQTDRLREIGTQADEGKLIEYIRILEEAAGKMSYASAKRVLFEVAIIKLCRPQMREDYSSLVERIELLEKKIEEIGTAQPKVVYRNAPAGEAEEERSEEDMSREMIQRIRDKYPEADAEEILAYTKEWKSIAGDLTPTARNWLDKGRVSPGENAAEILLVFEKTPETEMAIEYFEKTSDGEKSPAIADIEAAIAKRYQKTVHVGVRVISAQEKRSEAGSYIDLSKINFDHIEIRD